MNQGETIPVDNDEMKHERGKGDWDGYDDDEDGGKGEEDEEKAEPILLDGANLLPDFQDHFSLPKESCMVRSRKKANGVRV